MLQCLPDSSKSFKTQSFAWLFQVQKIEHAGSGNATSNISLKVATKRAFAILMQRTLVDNFCETDSAWIDRWRWKRKRREHVPIIAR